MILTPSIQNDDIQQFFDTSNQPGVVSSGFEKTYPDCLITTAYFYEQKADSISFILQAGIIYE